MLTDEIIKLVGLGLGLSLILNSSFVLNSTQVAFRSLINHRVDSSHSERTEEISLVDFGYDSADDQTAARCRLMEISEGNFLTG